MKMRCRINYQEERHEIENLFEEKEESGGISFRQYHG